jgi:hypothetical protein
MSWGAVSGSTAGDRGPFPLPKLSGQDYVQWDPMLMSPRGKRLWDTGNSSWLGELSVLHLPTDRPSPIQSTMGRPIPSLRTH